MKDEDFNRYRPMFPQSKVWKIKIADQPARLVGPPQPIGPTSQIDRSDCSDQPIRPVEPSAEPIAKSAPPISVPSVDEAPAVPPTAEDEELVDYEASPERTIYGDQCGALIFGLLRGSGGGFGSSSVQAP